MRGRRTVEDDDQRDFRGKADVSGKYGGFYQRHIKIQLDIKKRDQDYCWEECLHRRENGDLASSTAYLQGDREDAESEADVNTIDEHQYLFEFHQACGGHYNAEGNDRKSGLHDEGEERPKKKGQQEGTDRNSQCSLKPRLVGKRRGRFLDQDQAKHQRCYSEQHGTHLSQVHPSRAEYQDAGYTQPIEGEHFDFESHHQYQKTRRPIGIQ